MTTRTAVRRSPKEGPEKGGEWPATSEDVESISQRLAEPPWLREKRLQALSAYRAFPMPNTSDEAWRRTDLRSFPASAFRDFAADEGDVDPALLGTTGPVKLGPQLLVRPGHATQRRGQDELARQGVVFADWATAVRENDILLREYLGSVVSPQDGKFAALASAMASVGVVLYVPPGVNLDEPLHSVLWAPGAGKAFFGRVLVILDQGASATLIHETASPTEPEGQTFHSGIVELAVREGARLTFVEVQNWGEHVWNFTHERAKVHLDGHLDWAFGAIGSHLTKNFTDLDLVGRGAVGRMSGFYIVDGVQHLDHDTQQNHLAPDTTSDLLFKGALLGRSRSVWQGMIYVAPGAQKTDGYQANRNLVLSPQARADSIPGLEILADDVRCTHGATVGRLEEEPVYYLMSRGLPRKEAERLAVDAFFAPIMERVPSETVRMRFQHMIDEKLGMPGAVHAE